MGETVNFFQKNGGARAYDDDSFIYKLRNSAKGKPTKYYICVNAMCQAKICLIDDKIISRSGAHNHGPMKSLLDVELVEASKLAEALASVNTSSTRSFVSSIAAQLDTPEKIAMISSSKALQMRFERARKKLHKFPPLPRTLVDMAATYPDSLRSTKGNSVFLRHEGCVEGSNYENSWLFVSDVGVDQLIRSSVWVMDGTFASAPHPFRQIFCINIISNSGRSVPVVWALLSNKTKKLYREGVFKVLMNIMSTRTGGEEIDEKTFIADFEKGISGAAKEVFEDVQIFGCLFHFRQAVRDKVKSLGIAHFELENEEFQLLIKMVGMLAYVPPERVQEFWKKGVKIYALQFLSKPGSSSANRAWDAYAFPIHQFLVYVRDTWVGRKSGPASPDGSQAIPDIAPMFPPEQWSAWRSVSDPSIPSTTGGNESYNIQLKRVCNGGVWRVIDAIRTEESLSQKKIADLAAAIPLSGNAQHKKRVAARMEMLSRVKNIVQKGDGSHGDIMKALVAQVEKTSATDV